MTFPTPLRHRLLLSTAVAAGCLTFFATQADAAPCAAGKVHDKHGHCVAPAHKKKVATPSAAAPYAATPVAPVAVAEPAYAAPSRSTRSAGGSTEDVVVTGSILRNPNLTSASPITRLTAKELQRRGIVTVAQALQQLSANNAGNLPASFSANGAFANGASGVSLRGLTVDSTLILIDGQRSAYYPLADDGERNFVDINSIPMSTVQNLDVEKDGASATYGADAVAGVVNIITRKEIKGFEGGAEGGVSQHGDSGHQRLYATYGIGDLKRDNYNFYVNGEYQQDDLVYNRDRGYPYNTGDLTGIGGTNGNPGSVDTGTVGATTTAVVRSATVASKGAFPYTAGSFSGNGPYQPINASLGCDGLKANKIATGTVCEQDIIKDYRVITPDDRRISATAHFTGNLSDHVQFTSQFTYSQNDVFYTGTPQNIRVSSANNNISLSSIYLPVYLTNGQLNPQNPFAAQGKVARLWYRFGDIPRSTEDFSQVYRGSAAVNGWYPSNWGGDWRYGASFVGMSNSLLRTEKGALSYGAVLQAIGDGSYNFMDPSKNTQAERNKLSPTLHQLSNSQLYSTDMTVSKGLFKLPGGMVDLGIGGQFRSESLDDPSFNPVNNGNPTSQLLTINGFSSEGSRRTSSGYFEVGVPIIKQLTLDVAGRYDHYSEGFSHFSPKVGVVIKPIKQFTLRGTFSKGFRAPSFAEINSTSIGFISYTPTDAAFIAAHNGDNYTKTYSLGLNSVGNPDLKPEIATNFTGGFIFQPKAWLSFTTDYYHIKKTNYITLADYSGPLDQYFANGGSAPGVTPDVEDQDAPGKYLRPGVVNVGYINAAKMNTSGLDMQLQATIPLPTKYLRDVTWTSTGEATYVFNYNVNYPGIGLEKYAGTLGPANITSASGTPKWRANWSNTFAYKKAAFTVTTYYTSGYKLTAEDVTGPGTADDCSQAQQGFAGDPQRCHVGGFWDVDFTLSYQLTKSIQLYANMYNVGNTRPPLDTGTYGGYQYNPAWGSAGIIGRNFHFGATAKF